MLKHKFDPTFILKLNAGLEDTVVNISNHFLLDARSRDLSPNTIRDYTNEITALLAWLQSQGIEKIEDLTADVIRAYMVSLQDRRNKGGQFAAYRVIRTWTYWWERETDGVYRSPIRKIKPPRVNRQPLQGVSVEVVHQLLDACIGANRLRDRAVIMFLADTGVRGSELCAINISDLQLGRGAVEIRYGKGGRRRTCFFGRITRRELRRYIKSRTWVEGHAPLFATHDEQRLTFSGLRQIVRRLSSRASIDEPGLHDFRRFCTLQMLRNGADLLSISRQLGHATTHLLRIYARQTDEDLEQVHARSSPIDHVM